MDDAINFTYEDTDSYQNEISELYSYIEESEFLANRNAFEESMEDSGLPLTWKHMVKKQKSRAINYLMSTLEVSCRETRIKSCRALSYLVQGNFGDCLTLEEQANNSKENVFLLHEFGLYSAFVQQLLIEANLSNNTNNSNCEDPQQSNISSSQIFNDSAELRLILAVLSTITETMYQAKDSSDPKIQELRNQFILELQSSIGDGPLSVVLFQMLNNFCSGMAPHYPVRKIILLLWKVILITLGGTDKLKDLRDRSRLIHNLGPALDNTIEVTKSMRPCSPPLIPDAQARLRTLTGSMAANRRKVCKQPAFDDAVFAYAKECLLSSLADLHQPENEGEAESSEDPDDISDSAETIVQSNKQDNNVDLYNLDDPLPIAEPSPDGTSTSSADSGLTSDNEPTSSTEKDAIDSIYEASEGNELDQPMDIDEPAMRGSDIEVGRLKQGALHLQLDFNRANSPQDSLGRSYKGLPWTPKVRKPDLQQHLSNIRQKYLGYCLENDLTSTFGLPAPIIEGIAVLKKHMYVSLAEVQLEREETLEKYPLTQSELDPEFRDAAAEKLYQALLPRLPQYMIALLKILLAASTNTKNISDRAESINIMAEINADANCPNIIQRMKMNADAGRHKEIIIKAISAILILLLKHLKVNHIYQFEYVSQQLMFANCIPLILKFLSQDIYSYILSSKSTISAIDFPACVIGEQPELTAEAIEMCSFQPYCWRNMFACMNLVRILNKLTKWKHSRIMMLVVFKSAPTLAKALSVRHPMFQLYILKLLKVQLKFLGRQWKKSNMKLISAIYQKVRHRLTDDWAYSNDNEARPWDFQGEEFTLQANINKFHRRRYRDILAPPNQRTGRANSVIFNQSDRFNGFDDYSIDEDYDFGLLDTSSISPHFERNYERWLESEVFQRTIDWDKLLEKEQ